MPRGRAKQSKSIETLTHEEARRRNLPSAEHQPLMRQKEQSPVRVAQASLQGQSGFGRAPGGAHDCRAGQPV